MDTRLMAEIERLRAIIAMQSRMLDVAVSGEFAPHVPTLAPVQAQVKAQTPDPTPAQTPARATKDRAPAPMPKWGTQWSDDDQLTMIDLTEQGVSRVEIARVLGRSPKAIYKRQHTLGLDR